MSYMFLLAFDRTSWTEPLSFRLARQRDTREVKPLNWTLQTQSETTQLDTANTHIICTGKQQ